MKTFFQQLSSLWGQLGINQRVSLGVAALAVVGGMIALVLWSGRPQMQLLYGRLGEKELGEVAAVLQEQGVKYELGNGSVYVASEQVHKLRMALAQKGVPAGEGVGFEVFDRANFGISDFVQRTNYVRALQGELSRTISQLQGVRSARVLIVVPENRLLFSDVKAKPTASVFVEGQVGASQVNAIRFLVANAVEGLRADDVAVVDHHGTALTDGLKEDSQLGSASTQMKLRKSVEDYLSGKAETMLSKVLGPGAAVVRVSADIDSESTTRTEERYDPDTQVVRTETSTDDTTITKETETSPTADTGAGAGAGANTPGFRGEGPNAQKTLKDSEQSKKNKTQNYEINRITINSVKGPGSIARVTAAVFVASKATPRTPAEMDGLRRMVANSIGIKGEDKELMKIVTLEEVSFENPAEPKTGALDTLLAHPDLLKNGIAIGVALILFVMFLRMLKGAKPDEIPMELLEAQRSTQLEEAAAGPVTAQMLNDMIRQKPDNVGLALRDWMSSDAKH
ncbi:MAG: flagellar basal-body MS-ring/collar protein FliF [Chthoniobacteraceae bacterium]